MFLYLLGFTSLSLHSCLLLVYVSNVFFSFSLLVFPSCHDFKICTHILFTIIATHTNYDYDYLLIGSHIGYNVLTVRASLVSSRSSTNRMWAIDHA